jgi:hypothetical protein
LLFLAPKEAQKILSGMGESLARGKTGNGGDTFEGMNVVGDLLKDAGVCWTGAPGCFQLNQCLAYTHQMLIRLRKKVVKQLRGQS